MVAKAVLFIMLTYLHNLMEYLQLIVFHMYLEIQGKLLNVPLNAKMGNSGIHLKQRMFKIYPLLKVFLLIYFNMGLLHVGLLFMKISIITKKEFIITNTERK